MNVNTDRLPFLMNKKDLSNRLIIEFWGRHGLPAPETEYRFVANMVGAGPGIRARVRLKSEELGIKLGDWRFDFAWPIPKVALEKEGGVWPSKRHVGIRAHGSSTGILRDMAKYNAAQVFGWKVFRVVPGDITNMETINLLKLVVK